MKGTEEKCSVAMKRKGRKQKGKAYKILPTI
jgi:hypothetical protein